MSSPPAIEEAYTKIANLAHFTNMHNIAKSKPLSSILRQTRFTNNRNRHQGKQSLELSPEKMPVTLKDRRPFVEKKAKPLNADLKEHTIKTI